jgi:hypothetical protein
MDINKVLSEHNYVLLTKAKLAKLCNFQISAVLLYVLDIQKWVVIYGMLIQSLTPFIIVKCYFFPVIMCVSPALNIQLLFYSCTAMVTELLFRHTQLIHTVMWVTGRMVGDSSQM